MNIYDSATIRKFYLDLDKGGYGDKNNLKTANDAPPGFLEDAPDCDDRDYYSHPNQTGWFDTQNKKGTFDYDCDGREIKEFTRVYSVHRVRDHKEQTTINRTVYTEGWKGGSPEFGQKGIYVSVEKNRPTKITRTQRCN